MVVNKVFFLLMGGEGGKRLFEVGSGEGLGYIELDRRGGNAYLKLEKKTQDCVGSISIAWSLI